MTSKFSTAGSFDSRDSDIRRITRTFVSTYFNTLCFYQCRFLTCSLIVISGYLES